VIELKQPRVSMASATAFPTKGTQYGTGGGSSLVDMPLIPNFEMLRVVREVKANGRRISPVIVSPDNGKRV
jgi:hypothetical protein